MGNLPVELLSQVSGGVHSQRDLRQLRVVDKIFHKLASPKAFRKLQVTNTIKSATGFLNILNSPELVAHVRVIEFIEDVSADGAIGLKDEADENDDDAAQRNTDDQAGEGRLDPAAIVPTLVSAYSLLHQAPSLHTLTFKFTPESFEENTWDEEDHEPSESLTMHWAILGAIANNSHPLPALRSLTLDNLVPFQNALYVTPYFTTIIASLHHLRLYVLVDTVVEGAYYGEPLVSFWEQAQEHILRPALALRSLTIETNLGVGMGPPLDFSVLTYPHLEALLLNDVHFDGTKNVPGSGGTEDFIARHGKTLKKLELRACMLNYPQAGAPTRFWSQIWNRYAEELEMLTELVVKFEHEEGDFRERQDAEMRYCSLSPGHDYYPTCHDIQGEEDDKAALEALKRLVESRK